MTVQVIEPSPVDAQDVPEGGPACVPVPVQVLSAPPAPAPAGGATTGQLATWLAQLEAAAGEPLSLTLTGATRQAHVHVGTLPQFRAWSDGLHAAKPHLAHDKLGPTLRAGVDVAGWEIRVSLSGPAVNA